VVKGEKRAENTHFGQLTSIGECLNIPVANLYAESNQNTSFPYTNHTVVTSSNSDTNTTSGSSSSGAEGKSSSGRISVPWLVAGLVGGGLAVVHSQLY
jgi:hypothetical protein